MEPILERAIAKRDAALREAAEWNTFIKRYQQLAGIAPDHTQSPDLARKAPSEHEIPSDSELGKTIETVEAILNEWERPVRLSELYDEVTKRGLVVGGKDPKGNFGARLWGSGRFRSISKSTGWWFKDRPWPPAGIQEDGDDPITETPNSSELFGAPKANGAEPFGP